MCNNIENIVIFISTFQPYYNCVIFVRISCDKCSQSFVSVKLRTTRPKYSTSRTFAPFQS